MVCDARQAGSKSAELDIRPGLDDALSPHGHCRVPRLEQRMGSQRRAEGSRRVLVSARSQCRVVSHLLWLAQSILGIHRSCRHVALNRLDHVSFLQNLKAGHVATTAVYPLGELCRVSQLFDLDAYITPVQFFFTVICW